MPKGRPKVEAPASNPEPEKQETIAEETKPVLSRKVSEAVNKELHRLSEIALRDTEEIDKGAPGTKLDRWQATARKVPFTMNWYKEHYTAETFTPESSFPVTLNGVKVVFVAGREITVPAPFASEYRRFRRHQMAPHAGLGLSNVDKPDVVVVFPGAGALPPEQTVST